MKKSDRCVNERHLIIDVIARVGSDVAQQLIINHVLNNSDATEEELRHALIHSMGFQIPIAELIASVDFLCFSENLKQEPSTVSDTQRRACLTFGAIIKNLRTNGNTTSALRLVNKLEEILGHHNESEFQKLYKPRNRRSAENPHTRENNHLRKKRMLIHALGNAGHPNSLQHIISYTETNQGTPSLRRAAAYALRHFSCNKSADALLKAAVNDPENIVKQAAFEVYSSHPAGKTFTKEQENTILSAHYSYPVVARVKRGTIADILKALSFELILPKVDWKKVIGTQKIGASFGIFMENYIKLKLAPFNGMFDLKVHDEAWAVGNLGLINRFIDIFRVKVCYQLNFHYDLNILKDFGIDSIQNLASAFDRIFHKIVDPIKEAIDLISDLIDMGRNHILEKMIVDLVALFKELPSLIKEMAENLYHSMLKLNSFDGYPLVDRVKKLINRIRVFIDDVKADIFGFYHSVADAITVSLPFVGKEIKEGFELIGDSWKFWENPIASFHGMENALLKFKLAVVTFVEAKQRVMDSLNVFKGGLPYWFHPVEEVKGMVNDVMDIMGMIKDEIVHYGGNSDVQSCSIDITDGLTMCENKNTIHKLVDEAVVPVVNRTLFRVKEIATPFWDKATELIDLFKRIKSSYDFIREAINKGKYFVQKIFGAKFHRKFPKKPGPCESSSCACGEYKNKGDGRYGLDLEIDTKSKFDAFNPMTGLVSWYNEKKFSLFHTDQM
uniref:Uncharacterized protein LOC111138229 n=1 Tax=Crassostrea virginica TaxID=6565 RepID=A0A8B8F1W6_CRAVI|nr:uncharacterized protein LOC111138229 [Crassostrea virginica]